MDLNAIDLAAFDTVYLLPFIGAVIGWLTNFLAVKMLFHPKRPVRFFFFNIQGVFPKRQKALAKKLGEIVSRELVSVNDITKKLEDSATSDRSLKIVTDQIEKTLVRKLPLTFPIASMFISSDLIDRVRGMFIGDLRSLIGELVDRISGDLEGTLDVHEIVEEKVASFSSDKLEQILYSIMRREFKFIEIVGAVLGFLIGVSQIFLVRL